MQMLQSTQIRATHRFILWFFFTSSYKLNNNFCLFVFVIYHFTDMQKNLSLCFEYKKEICWLSKMDFCNNLLIEERGCTTIGVFLLEERN